MNYDQKLQKVYGEKILEIMDKLKVIESISELRVFHSLRLKKLRGDRKGQFSIRVNRKYRICFAWIDKYAVNVERTDYH